MLVSKRSYGLSFIVLVIFIILKLNNLVDWSWFWVFSPLWVDILGTVVVYYTYKELTRRE